MIAIAERLRLAEIVTLDHRHFWAAGLMLTDGGGNLIILAAGTARSEAS